MPILNAFNISHQFDNGELLFEHLSITMNTTRVGLVGKNGVGKSILASMLTGKITPSSGLVNRPNSFATYHQQPSELLSNDLNIAQFIGKDRILEALRQIEAGNCDSRWFDLINDEWELEAQLSKELSSIGLPQDPYFPCAKLSGGQMARLQLWQLFNKRVDLLILDEPSNHLDREAKQWLIESMNQFDGSILLISHDRQLLQEMDEIWELSRLGLQVFGGNYDFYATQKQTERQAVERQLASVNKQQKRLEEQYQRNQEKAAQRASQGNTLRKNGSQSKILLDGKKESAEGRASNRNKSAQLRQAHLERKELALKSRQEQLSPQKLYLLDTHNRSRKVVSIYDGILSFGRKQPITLQIFANDKMHLLGRNGSGKSTLLKTLLGNSTLSQGELQVSTPLYYLDQHFGIIKHELSLLDNLLALCHGIKISDARTLLAGIGFRRDSVHRLGQTLSGGEKMKLAMLIASHQATHPLLLLDEPDNHLDLDSKIMLAEALNAYQGGYVLISHDQSFAEESGVNRHFDLD
ncbi:ATP-binding cassette domain-containing protein [Vibrio panuliri]|uniref:Elongation factor 3 n=1 Tax=Vibrio panuliri TaxID=1381081 RepID=A0ABX3FSX5_9VIBR|nr:ATP-binding cassette domain-containing protein [Vibrio panuliri]KAB1457070.1 ABC-F family ATP-binding cassette domain-containing protein [Vibrio panuliri]OLQ96097.1 elongation factor 3 [Vibrio panuliri]